MPMHPVPIAPNLHRNSAPTTSAKLVIRTSKNWVLPPRPRPNRRNTIQVTHGACALPTPALTPSSSAAATPTPHAKRKRENSLPVNLKKVKKDKEKEKERAKEKEKVKEKEKEKAKTLSQTRDLSSTSVENCLAFLKFDDEDSTNNNTDIDDDLFSVNSPLSSTTCTPLTSNASDSAKRSTRKPQKFPGDKKFAQIATGGPVLSGEHGLDNSGEDAKPLYFTINNITSATTTAAGSIAPLDDPITTTEELSTKELDDFYSYIPPSLEELIEEQDLAKTNNGLLRDSLMNRSYESMNLMMFNDPNNTTQQDDLIIDTDGDMFAFM